MSDEEVDHVFAAFCLWGAGSAIVAGTYVASLSRSGGPITVGGARHHVSGQLASRSDRPEIRHGGAVIGLSVLLIAVLFTKRFRLFRRAFRVVLAGTLIGGALGGLIGMLSP